MNKKKTAAKKRLRPQNNDPLRLPFLEHLLELRRRVFIVSASVVGWSFVAYAFEQQIVHWLLKPANGQQFIYTTVGGGIDFLFRVCLYVGIVLSIPIIIYQMLRYLQPVIGQHPTRFIVLGSITSGVLALLGILFGYFIGLPAALNFLLNQFNTSDISALITIQSYLSFVILYLLGSSLMFQVPLIIYFINRIKPLRVRTLLKQERWVILFSFIAGAIINPSPRAQDMALLAVPMIISYQIGVVIVWYVNRYRVHSPEIQQLFERDTLLQQERKQRLQTIEYVLDQAELSASMATPPVNSVSSAETSKTVTASPTPAKSTKTNQETRVHVKVVSVDG
ncbi:twin-arginine translocase subunit TatC [Candidatus Saccharibacteria bacterium]|nr:twin-arginine translocase subunit TatC [Candidatus Saccharibacteria bacterium]